jgi:hypothetical protein
MDRIETMRLWQLNRRPKDETEKQHVLRQIASDMAIAIMPFEDDDRKRIIEMALASAEAGNNIRELYRVVEEEFYRE